MNHSASSNHQQQSSRLKNPPQTVSTSPQRQENIKQTSDDKDIISSASSAEKNDATSSSMKNKNKVLLFNHKNTNQIRQNQAVVDSMLEDVTDAQAVQSKHCDDDNCTNQENNVILKQLKSALGRRCPDAFYVRQLSKTLTTFPSNIRKVAYPLLLGVSHSDTSFTDSITLTGKFVTYKFYLVFGSVCECIYGSMYLTFYPKLFLCIQY